MIPPAEAWNKNASRIFGWALLAYLLCWTLVPTLTQPNAPLDTIEGFVWGHAWQWGTYKHPPLQAFLLEITTYLTGHSGLGYFGLSALCGGVTLWAIYRTGRLFTSKLGALLAAMMAMVLPYFTFLIPEFNPNVLSLSIWALAGYCFAHAVLKHKNKYWFFLGVVFALGFYAKYSIALLGIGFFLFLLYVLLVSKIGLPNKKPHPGESRGPESHEILDSGLRRNEVADEAPQLWLLKPQPYLALAFCLLLLAPHLYWLVTHHFLPFAYAASRAETASGPLGMVIAPMRFLASQTLVVLPALLPFATLWNKKNDTPSAAPKLQRRLLFWLAFAPTLLSAALGFITAHQLRDMWGMPYLSFIPLWLITLPQVKIGASRLKHFLALWAFLFALMPIAFAGNMLFAPAFGVKPMRGHFPGETLSQDIHAIWQEKMGAVPLHTITGESWLAGNAAFYSTNIHERPQVWIDGDITISPWIDVEDVKKNGAMLIWRDGETPDFTKILPSFAAQGFLNLPWKIKTTAAPVRLHWAILPPASKNN